MNVPALWWWTRGSYDARVNLSIEWDHPFCTFVQVVVVYLLLMALVCSIWPQPPNQSRFVVPLCKMRLQGARSTKKVVNSKAIVYHVKNKMQDDIMHAIIPQDMQARQLRVVARQRTSLTEEVYVSSFNDTLIYIWIYRRWVRRVGRAELLARLYSTPPPPQYIWLCLEEYMYAVARSCKRIKFKKMTEFGLFLHGN